MRISKNLAVLAVFTWFAPAVASGGDAWDRLGRLWGYGWSDGYHACRDAPYVPGVSLPPEGFAATSKPTSGCTSCGAVSGTSSEHWMPEAWQTENLVPALAEPLPAVGPSTSGNPTGSAPKPEPLPAAKAEEDPLSWEKQPSKIGKFVCSRVSASLR